MILEAKNKDPKVLEWCYSLPKGSTHVLDKTMFEETIIAGLKKIMKKNSTNIPLVASVVMSMDLKWVSNNCSENAIQGLCDASLVESITHKTEDISKSSLALIGFLMKNLTEEATMNSLLEAFTKKIVSSGSEALKSSYCSFFLNSNWNVLSKCSVLDKAVSCFCSA